MSEHYPSDPHAGESPWYGVDPEYVRQLQERDERAITFRYDKSADTELPIEVTLSYPDDYNREMPVRKVTLRPGAEITIFVDEECYFSPALRMRISTDEEERSEG